MTHVRYALSMQPSPNGDGFEPLTPAALRGPLGHSDLVEHWQDGLLWQSIIEKMAQADVALGARMREAMIEVDGGQAFRTDALPALEEGVPLELTEPEHALLLRLIDGIAKPEHYTRFPAMCARGQVARWAKVLGALATPLDAPHEPRPIPPAPKPAPPPKVEPAPAPPRPKKKGRS